jgi:hypothetical protein
VKRRQSRARPLSWPRKATSRLFAFAFDGVR